MKTTESHAARSGAVELLQMRLKAPIIAPSGLKAEDKIADAAQLGVKTFLPKPYSAEKLLKTVDAVLKEG
jgi:DNA-binding response OmpR family regulator